MNLKRPSPPQFYIVTGKKVFGTRGEPDGKATGRPSEEIFARLQNENNSLFKIMEFYRSGNKEELAILRDTFVARPSWRPRSGKTR